MPGQRPGWIPVSCELGRLNYVHFDPTPRNHQMIRIGSNFEMRELRPDLEQGLTQILATIGGPLLRPELLDYFILGRGIVC